MAITYTDKITVSDYNALRKAVGWNLIEDEMAQVGLDHTWFLLVGKDGDRTVSCLRVLGDGGYCMLIDDVMVHPDYQGQGIGTQLMQRMLARLEQQGVYMVSVIYGEEALRPFYEKFGFFTMLCGQRELRPGRN